MTRIILSIALAGGLAWSAQPAGAEEAAPESAPVAAPVALESEQAKLSYAIGIQFGTSLKRDGVELDLATLARAMDDVLARNHELAAGLRDLVENGDSLPPWLRTVVDWAVGLAAGALVEADPDGDGHCGGDAVATNGN